MVCFKNRCYYLNMENLFSPLIDMGMAGIFLAYLIFSKTKNDKRANEQQDKYEERIDLIRKENSQEQNKIRERFSSVINKYDNQLDGMSSERTEIRIKQESMLEEIKKEVNENGKAIAKLQIQVSGLSEWRSVEMR